MNIVRLLFFFVLLFAANSSTATLLGQTFQASALLGANVAQIDGDDLIGFNQWGYNAGLRVVAKLGDRWRVGPEILYSQQGSRSGANNLNASEFDQVTINTVEVPLMAYFKDWKITAEAGFAYQRLINYQIINSDGADVTEDIPFRDNLVNFQAGVTYYASPNWGFNFRWSKHISDLEASDDNLSLKGRSLSFRLVYTFGDGEKLPKPTPVE
ncbi:hypothetical protein CEQ90_12875 [Lewinellaceae bacterium SD302]|nr:hypothetical protein CEQ90_12875 [Lewinellaceae bacterium SD302]